MKNILLSIFKPNSLFSKSVIAIFIATILTLGALGYLDEIKQILVSESLTFQIGNYKLSAYKILKILLIFIILFWIASILSTYGEKKIRKIKTIKSSNKSLIIKGFQGGIYFIVIVICLDIIGIDFSTIAVVGGAIGIGVGFGLQKITSNFISGLILLFEKSIEEGDLIELSDGTSGFVRNTGARYTLVETFENREIMIPNEDFITNRVTNWTYTNTKGRIDINIGVAYTSDLDQVTKLILESALEHNRCSKDPGPECFLVDLAESSVNFTLYFWVDDITIGSKRPKSDVLFTIWKKFKDNNIQIPFPQREIHIKNQGDN